MNKTLSNLTNKLQKTCHMITEKTIACYREQGIRLQLVKILDTDKILPVTYYQIRLNRVRKCNIKELHIAKRRFYIHLGEKLLQTKIEL